MKIFLAGSIKIKNLEKEIKERIQNIIKNELTILVGDAYGVDKNVQEFLLKNNYKNVIIYTSMKRTRNNVGKWKVIHVDSKDKTGREKHTIKDIKMAEDADYGLMIWDGESQGTLNNIINLITNKKKVTVYLHKNEHKITSKEDLIKFIESLNTETQKLYIKLVTVSNNKKKEKVIQKINSQLTINQDKNFKKTEK